MNKYYSLALLGLALIARNSLIAMQVASGKKQHQSRVFGKKLAIDYTYNGVLYGWTAVKQFQDEAQMNSHKIEQIKALFTLLGFCKIDKAIEFVRALPFGNAAQFQFMRENLFGDPQAPELTQVDSYWILHDYATYMDWDQDHEIWLAIFKQKYQQQIEDLCTEIANQVALQLMPTDAELKESAQGASSPVPSTSDLPQEQGKSGWLTSGAQWLRDSKAVRWTFGVGALAAVGMIAKKYIRK